MVTTSKGGMSSEETAKQLPEWALKIREARKACGPTQARFAKKFGRTRTTVARWETNARKPGSKEFEALGRFTQEKCPSLSAYFYGQARAGEISAQEREARLSALHILDAIEQDAALGREPAKELLAEAGRDPVEVRREHRRTLEGLGRGMANGEFSHISQGIYKRIATIENIWLARQLRAGKIAEARRRLNKRLLAIEKQRVEGLAEVAIADKAKLDILTQKIKLFLDELSSDAFNERVTKQQILAAHEELSPIFRELQGTAESLYAAQMLEALEQAARAVVRPYGPDDIHAAAASLQWTLRQKSPAAPPKNAKRERRRKK